MDAVPTLCATSTVGVAAVGYAFGRLSTTESQPHSNKRKAVDRVSDRFSNIFAPPTTPREPGQPASAPTTRLSKTNVLRRPQSSSFPRNSIRRTDDSISGTNPAEKEDWRVSAFGRTDDPLGNHAHPTGTRAEAGTAKSSWLRRMSTMSSLHTESMWSSSRPGTPSLSFSNGSSAPIMPSNVAPVTPRNKLVKRATSQRVLHNSSFAQSSYSKTTLRRPATSHQRSANLQEQLSLIPAAPQQHDVPRPSFQNGDGPSADHGEDAVTEQCQSLFRCQVADFSKENSSKPAVGTRTSNRNGYIKCIVPVSGDKAILLKAASIMEIATDERSQLPSTPVQIHGPFASTPVDSVEKPSTNVSHVGVEPDLDPKSRSSFSISEYFPSPSPSTWKMARTGSLRRKQGSEGSVLGRRTASAPQTLEKRSSPHTGQSGSATRNHTSASPFHSKRTPSLTRRSNAQASLMRIPSSPLPPLNRLSAFEVDLSGTTTSHPPSPQPPRNSSPSSQTSPSIAIFPNSTAQTGPRSRTHRPSGAPSDRASTLIGSDNDNSRVFSVDGDEIDYRSETMYDSVRTGATGSSHSGVRGARIESVFEKPPPPELLKQNLAALQEKLASTNPLGDFIAEEEESLRTPVHMAQSYEDDLPTPSRYPKQVSSSLSFASSPPVPLHAVLDGQGYKELHNPDADDFWGFEEGDSTSWNNSEKEESLSDHELWSTAVCTAPDSAALQGHPVIVEHNDLEERPKSNLFEWSERSNPEPGNPQGSSPRPKTVHGKQSTERGSRSTGRRGASGLHLRSQSVPLSPENTNHRKINNASKLDAWILGNKGVSEDWDNDFEFDEPMSLTGPNEAREGKLPTAVESHGMLVPRAILERQASVHGQFGQVKELTQLVEELKLLRHQASQYGIIHGQASELWKEAEGIIDLATLDEEEQDYQTPRSPSSPSFEFDGFDDESPTSQRRPMSHLSDVSETPTAAQDRSTSRYVLPQSSATPPNLGTPPQGRNRKDSVAKAKSVLEHIHQQRSSLDPPLKHATKSTQKKLPFDTTSLRDLVTRAGVVTRALKEIVRRVENPDDPFPTPDRRPSNPPDPPFSQIFHQPHSSPSSNRSPRMGNSSSHNSFLGGSMTGNDNDINGHMKMMTVV